MFSYALQDGRYALRIGRFTIGQSAFMIAAAALVGLGGGFGAVLFRAMIFGAQWLAFGQLGRILGAHLLFFGVLIQLAVGGALAAFIASRFAPEAKGHGVPEVMEAVALRGGRMRPRVIAVKSLASAISIGFGGSCGREGPIVQIGSAIGSVLGQLARAPVPIVRTLVACGAAAGISATFNAPIGGVFFASEVILGEFAPRSFAAIVVASVVVGSHWPRILRQPSIVQRLSLRFDLATGTSALRIAWHSCGTMGDRIRQHALLCRGRV